MAALHTRLCSHEAERSVTGQVWGEGCGGSGSVGGRFALMKRNGLSPGRCGERGGGRGNLGEVSASRVGQLDPSSPPAPVMCSGMVSARCVSPASSAASRRATRTTPTTAGVAVLGM